MACNPDTTTVRLICTSDLHGKFVPWDYALNQESLTGSVAQLANAVAAYRTDATLVMDAGDTIQDNSADIFVGQGVHPMVQAMNMVGYDVWVTGNHDYNYGMGVVRQTIGDLDARALVGNVFDPDGMPLSDGHAMFDVGGVRVAVIGMVTPNIVRWDPANLAGWEVTDPVAECRKLIDGLAGSYDLLVGVMHMGVEREYDVHGSGVRDIVEACPEFDVVVASHSHAVVEGEVINEALIVENREHAATMAVVDVTMRRCPVGWEVADSASEIVDVSQFPPDPAIVGRLARYDEMAQRDAELPIGRLVGGSLAPEDEVPGITEALVRDTALVDLIHSVQMHYTGARVSATALSRLESNMHEGVIRKCDTALIYKFTNMLYKVRFTGQQLKRYMEWSARFYNTFKPGDLTVSFNPNIPNFNYDMFAGVCYEVDVSREPGARIRNLTWPDGSEILDDELIDLATYDYRANSALLVPGVIFDEGDMPQLLEMDVRGDIGGVRELIGDYIANVMGGEITPICNGNWRIVGNDCDDELRKAAIRLVREGKLSVAGVGDRQVANSAAITESDVLALIE